MSKPLLFGVVGFVLLLATVFGAGGAGAPAVKGLPNSLAELDAWYVTPPQGSNAATFYLRAFEVMKITDAESTSKDLPLVGQGTLPAVGARFAPGTRAIVSTISQRNATAWEFLRKGATLDQARYPINLNDYEMLLPHLAKVRLMVRFGKLKVLLHAEDRQPQRSADVLIEMLAAGQSVKHEPVLISQLVRVACLNIEKDALERVLNLVVFASADLGRISSALAKAEADEAAIEPFTRAFVAEKVTTLAFMDLPPGKIQELLLRMWGTNNVVGDDFSSAMNGTDFTTNLQSQRLFAEETYNRALQIRQHPFPERLKADDYVQARAIEAKSNKFPICGIMLPALGKSTSREAGGLAMLRLAQTSVALEQFRAANQGRYPTALNELAPLFMPSVPQDPFDGQSLRYGKTANGYKLYSIGLNGVDDGGVRGTNSRGDFVFEILKATKLSSP